MVHRQRMIIRNVALGLFIQFMAAQAFAAEDDAVILPSEAQRLDIYQKQTLESDGPFHDTLIDAQGAVWIAGKTSVWRWDLENRTLVRMPLLDSSAKDGIHKIAPAVNGLYAATNRSLFHVQLNPKKVVRVDHPNLDQGKTYGLTFSEDALWWLHQDGIMKFAGDGKEQVATTLNANENRQAQIGWFDGKNQLLWLATGGKILVSDLRHSPPKTKAVHQAKEAFIDMQKVGDKLYAHTNFAMLQFNPTLQKLEQTAPVQGRKKLLAFDISEKTHTYLFNDRLLEIYDINASKRQQTTLELPARAVVSKIQHAANTTVVLTDTQVLAFKHHTALTVSKTEEKKKTTEL